jgi:cytochrome b561
MWQWHIYIGYVLVGLIAFRFLLPAFDEMKIQNPLMKQLTVEEKFQRWTYIPFYLGTIIS